MKNIQCLVGFSVASVAMGLMASPVLAGDPKKPGTTTIVGTGEITETTDLASATVSVVPTDGATHVITGITPKTDWPKTRLIGYDPNRKTHTDGHITVPTWVKTIDAKGKTTDVPVKDYEQTTVDNNAKPPAPKKLIQSSPSFGATLDLSIESMLTDSATGLYYLVNPFFSIAGRIGINTRIWVPDLFADTNGDGAIGDGDYLYSLVDMDIYLNAAPSFHLGDKFQIVNGVVATLPGMWFSDSPFGFDPTLGFTTNGSPVKSPTFSGFSFPSGGTDAEARAAHGLTAIPEPESWVMMLAGFGLVGASLRWSSRITRRAQAEVDRMRSSS